MFQGRKDKKRRSDYGQVQTTERDIEILRWIGEQYAARFDHLQILAARKSEKGLLHQEGEIGYSGIQRLYRRWMKAGWVEKRKVLAGEPQWIWLTKKGLQHIELEYPYRELSVTKLLHVHPTNAVRLHIEQKLGARVQWISERVLTQAGRKKNKHMPDGEIIFQGTRVGIEVERSRKTNQRLHHILRGLKMTYENVWYFAGDECYLTVKNAMESIPGHQKAFQLYRLADAIKSVQSTHFRKQSTS